jgi:hypothetical protein
MAHIPHGLLVAKNLPLVEAHAQVPVDGSGHNHGRQEEHVIDGVENVGRATASDCHDRGPDLSPERPAVGQGDEASSIDQSLQLGGYISEVGRGAEDNCISRLDLFQVIVHIILLDAAPSIPLLEALQAGNAAPHGFPANPQVLCAPAGGFQRFEHLLEHDLRIAAWPGASVYGYGFHDGLLLVDNDAKLRFVARGSRRLIAIRFDNNVRYRIPGVVNSDQQQAERCSSD